MNVDKLIVNYLLAFTAGAIFGCCVGIVALACLQCARDDERGETWDLQSSR